MLLAKLFCSKVIIVMHSEMFSDGHRWAAFRMFIACSLHLMMMYIIYYILYYRLYYYYMLIFLYCHGYCLDLFHNIYQLDTNHDLFLEAGDTKYMQSLLPIYFGCMVLSVQIKFITVLAYEFHYTNKKLIQVNKVKVFFSSDGCLAVWYS